MILIFIHSITWKTDVLIQKKEIASGKIEDDVLLERTALY
jgi:hypothetical protein